MIFGKHSILGFGNKGHVSAAVEIQTPNQQKEELSALRCQHLKPPRLRARIEESNRRLLRPYGHLDRHSVRS